LRSTTALILLPPHAVCGIMRRATPDTQEDVTAIGGAASAIGIITVMPITGLLRLSSLSCETKKRE